ncbi:MAG: DUF1214 domain-containing protein [Myxococcales bacterium]|nr:DUF1214 domain-containing protein [Myxococcales bacterium]
MSDDARTALHAAWDDMIRSLERARDAIDQPERMPPPQSDRNLAEGYRYLMGFVHAAVERAFHEDPHFPFVRHALQLVNKGTIDNSDAIYFVAPIDGRETYRLRGRAAAARGRKPPHYLIFEATDGCMAGDSGSLAELRPGVKARMGTLDSSALQVEPDGSFEILLAPERPAGHTGNFLPTFRRVKRPNPDDPDAPLERYACHLSGRQLFYDWEHEDPCPLTLECERHAGRAPAPLSSADAALALRRLGELVRGPMAFWNQFYTVLLETYGKRDGEAGEPYMPRNAFNAVSRASGATGGGQATNLYAGGVFELAPDEALIVENDVRVAPQFFGLQLANLWGESLDFANHQSSLNGFQSQPDADGVVRYVVAHRDPGVPNWLDTTGQREGFQTLRWSYSETPPEDRWPRVRARKVGLAEVRSQLPAGTRRVEPEERARQIRVRQAHVRRRYRVF